MFDAPIEIKYVPIIAVLALRDVSISTRNQSGRTYSDSTALNATVLPMLMSETMQVKMAVATIAFAGTWKRGST